MAQRSGAAPPAEVIARRSLPPGWTSGHGPAPCRFCGRSSPFRDPEGLAAHPTCPPPKTSGWRTVRSHPWRVTRHRTHGYLLYLEVPCGQPKCPLGCWERATRIRAWHLAYAFKEFEACPDSTHIEVGNTRAIRTLAELMLFEATIPAQSWEAVSRRVRRARAAAVRFPLLVAGSEPGEASFDADTPGFAVVASRGEVIRGFDPRPLVSPEARLAELLVADRPARTRVSALGIPANPRLRICQACGWEGRNILGVRKMKLCPRCQASTVSAWVGLGWGRVKVERASEVAIERGLILDHPIKGRSVGQGDRLVGLWFHRPKEEALEAFLAAAVKVEGP